MCDRLLGAWRPLLERELGLWQVRLVSKNAIWRNRAMRQLLGLDDEHAIESWTSALQYVREEDRVRVEDAHSQALKTGPPLHILFASQSHAEPLR